MPHGQTHLLLAIIDLTGGSGTYCRLLAAGLKRYCPGQFVVDLLLMSDFGVVAEDRELFDHMQVLRRPVHTDFRRFYEPIAHARRIHSAIHAIDADLILTVGNYMNLIIPLVAPKRSPVIITVHNTLSNQMKTTRFGGIMGTLMHLAYPTQRIIAPSQGVADDLARHYSVRRTTVIPHGIDLDAVRRLGDEVVEDLPVEPYFVACGRLATQKDYPTLLRAYETARRAGLAEDLLILGDGDLLPELQRLAEELDIDRHVKFAGFRANPFPYMRHARGFVLSSVFEGFGLVILEAMAFGVPCISTDCPAGPAEILRDGADGLLVPMHNPAALAAAMLRVSTDAGLHARLSERSLARAQSLSLERMAHVYRDHFQAVLAGRGVS